MDISIDKNTFDIQTIIGKWESNEYSNGKIKCKYIFIIDKDIEFVDGNAHIKVTKQFINSEANNTEKIFTFTWINQHLFLQSNEFGNGYFPIVQNSTKIKLYRNTAMYNEFIDEDIFEIDKNGVFVKMKSKNFVIEFKKI